jgi:hypothetical protein
MRRGLLTIAAAGLLAGCAGSADDRGGVAGVERSGGSPWATPDEVEWLREVAEWSATFAEAGGRVASFEERDAFGRVLEGDDDAMAQYVRVLEPIRACTQSFRAAVGPAPTKRLRGPARAFARSCGNYRKGIALMLRAFDEQDPDLADEAGAAIEDAAKQAAVASGLLPPGEKQELPVRGGAVRGSRVEPRLSAAASRIADKEVEVRCWSDEDWRRLMVEEQAYTRGKVNEAALGFASAGGARLSLAPSVCGDLVRLAYAGARPSQPEERFALALSVATLAHESVHASGVADEPTAECHGIQRTAEAATTLGVEARYAAQLVQAYWERYEQFPEGYRSAECRDGGRLDLEPGSNRFP